MPKANVELVQRSQDLFAAGGIEATLPCFAEDVVVHPFPEWVEESEYHGHEGLRALIAVWIDNFDEFEFHASEIRDLGDTVLSLGETAGRIKGSGTPIRQPLGGVFSEFRDGRIGRCDYFLTWKQALEKVRLTE